MSKSDVIKQLQDIITKLEKDETVIGKVMILTDLDYEVASIYSDEGRKDIEDNLLSEKIEIILNIDYRKYMGR